MHSRRMSLLQPSGRDDVQVAPVGRPYTVYFPDTLKTTKDMTSVSRLLGGPSTSWGKNSPGSRGGEGAGGEVGSHVWQHSFQISLYVNLSLAPRNAFKNLSGMYCYWKSPTYSQVAASSQLTTHIVTWPQSLVASIVSSLITIYAPTYVYFSFYKREKFGEVWMTVSLRIPVLSKGYSFEGHLVTI